MPRAHRNLWNVSIVLPHLERCVMCVYVYVLLQQELELDRYDDVMQDLWNYWMIWYFHFEYRADFYDHWSNSLIDYKNGNRRSYPSHTVNHPWLNKIKWQIWSTNAEIKKHIKISTENKFFKINIRCSHSYQIHDNRCLIDNIHLDQKRNIRQRINCMFVCTNIQRASQVHSAHEKFIEAHHPNNGIIFYTHAHIHWDVKKLFNKIAIHTQRKHKRWIKHSVV